MINKKQTKKEIKKMLKKEDNKLIKQWRRYVLERDSYHCVICGRKDKINIHHIIPREIKEFKYDVDNGICLCPNHHRFSKEISPHKNSLIFYCFFIKHKEDQYKKLINKWKEYQQKKGIIWNVFKD